MGLSFLKSVGAMAAGVLAAVAPFQMVFFGKNNVAFGTLVKILRLEIPKLTETVHCFWLGGKSRDLGGVGR
jgi:hypothetical protein